MNWYIGDKGISYDLFYLLIYRCSHPVLMKTEWQKGLDLPFSMPATAIQKAVGTRCKKHRVWPFLYSFFIIWVSLSLVNEVHSPFIVVGDFTQTCCVNI